MRVQYERADIPAGEDFCPAVQCAFCSEWMCSCQVQTRCADHFTDPCLIEGGLS